MSPASPSTHSAAPSARLVVVGPWLGASEARLLVARGLLWPVLPGVFATGRPCPSLRAAALASFLRPSTVEHGVVQDLGAAWIMGCAWRPERFDCTVGRRRGQALDLAEARLLRQTFRTHQPYDLVRVGPLRVTSPVRTATDLALGSPGADRDLALLTMMAAPDLRCGPATVAAAIRALPYAVGRGAALARVERLAELLESNALPAAERPSSGGPGPGQEAIGAGREPVIR